MCKSAIESEFINSWKNDMDDVHKYPILRSYRLFKGTFKQEKYLSLTCEFKYISAIAQLRASSHTLAIEKGRHERPKKPIELRLCKYCNVIEDEVHFVTDCQCNVNERNILYENVNNLYPNFQSLSNNQKFIFIMQNENSTVLTWFGKFIHKSFIKRNINNL